MAGGIATKCYQAAEGDCELALELAVIAVQRGLWVGLPCAFPEMPVERLFKRRRLARTLYVEQHLGTPAIAKRLGVSHSTVRDDLEAMGVRRRQENRKATPEERAARELEVERLYLGGLTCAEIAAELGLTTATVFNDLRRRHVPTRSIARRPVPR